MKDNTRQMHTPKAASDFQREKKAELLWVGFEPATSHVLDGYSTKAAQLAESYPMLLDNAKQLSLINR